MMNNEIIKDIMNILFDVFDREDLKTKTIGVKTKYNDNLQVTKVDMVNDMQMIFSIYTRENKISAILFAGEQVKSMNQFDIDVEDIIRTRCIDTFEMNVMMDAEVVTCK